MKIYLADETVGDFELDLQITSEFSAEVAKGCATNNGCAATCPSSCVSDR